MNDNNLNNLEKSRLVAAMDRKQKTDYDEALYNLLIKTKHLLPHEIDDRSRRAIAKYVMEAWPILKALGELLQNDTDVTAMGAMTESLTIGYELGRLLHKPLSRGSDKTK